MLKALITDNLSDTGLRVLDEHADINVTVSPTLPIEKLQKEISQYNAIIVRSATKITPELLQYADNLELIIRGGIGVDNIDLDAATEKGILVANTPHSNSTTTAEHTFSLITSLARNIPQATISMKANQWEKKKFVGMELCGKTLGLIGLGNIGTIVAKIAKGFLMEVVTSDPFVADEYVESIGAKKVTLDELLASADIISLHCPINDTTKNIINAKSLAKMKPTALLVNCARGGLVDEVALEKALVNKKLAGAALDVFSEEPPGEHPLFKLDNVIMTPHLGASTSEAQTSVSVDACLLLAEYAKNRLVSSALNLPIKLPPEALSKTSFVTLAEQIGSLHGQLLKGAPSKIIVEYFGEEIKPIHELLQLHVTKALLNHILTGETINHVNAKLIANRRGIELTTSQIDAGGDSAKLNLNNLLRIKVVSQENKKTKERIIAGSVLGDGYLRITQIDDYQVDFMAQGHALLIINKDKPGAVGHVGTILAKHNINIARMSVSLPVAGKEALALYSINSIADKKVIDDILLMDSIDSCQIIFV